VHTRRACARACNRFFARSEQRGLTLTAIRLFDITAWVKDLDTHAAPSVKQQLAAVRMLFDWLVIGQVVPMNPAAAVRGPKHVGDLCPLEADLVSLFSALLLGEWPNNVRQGIKEPPACRSGNLPRPIVAP
jgi:site-specific recombinase XerD